MFVSLKQIHHLINSFPELKEWESQLLFTLEHENYKATKGGEDGYIIESAEPFVGLGQFSKYTWNSLRKLGLLEFAYEEAGTPLADLFAIRALFIDSQYALKRFNKHVEFTNEMAYLFHNQGAPAAISYLSTGVVKEPKQSKKALETIKIARGQMYG